ncbi:PIN domain-containing protein [uncultured Chryseobacterium sp.]|uniref:PIN domain-containing protein n=1 Tax=uncultured Chryseobacterium sp. TaxID=259322 RepID=UPI002588E831|nr:PIN domain-containing protein [uncultured Chryseobacterium sp.]
MIYIALDTNTWIYLANGTEPARLLHQIKQQVNTSEIAVLLPTIVKDEWDKHKNGTVKKESLKSFNNSLKDIEKTLKHLGDKDNALRFLLGDKSDKDELKELINKFKERKNEIENVIEENIQIIDEIFRTKAIVINIADHIYVKAGNFALEKKAPFGMKNSFADALILFSFLDYIKSHSIESSMFISYNTKDFCENDDKKSLHSDLVQEFTDSNSHFYKTLSEGFNKIKKDFISKEELNLIEYLQKDYEPYYCEVCNEMHNRLNHVTYHKHDLIDERIFSETDKSQLKFDFEEEGREVYQHSYNKTYTSIEVGSCDWCNTEHFICVKCGTQNAVWEHEYDDKKECEGCGLSYKIEPYDYYEGSQSSYIIPKETITCEKCGNEFNEEDMIENLCMKCEDEYSYDN